jgi:hypothetical protein
MYRVHIQFLILLIVLPLSVSAQKASTDAHGIWYAQHTPSYEFLQKGTLYYANESYEKAYAQFMHAAWWADKLAHAQLGRMYSLGQGVSRDPARGWAWLRLASEREYPQFVTTANTVWEALDEQQRGQAIAIFEHELEPKYGDAVAIDRTHLRMWRRLRQATGSRLGASYLPTEIIDQPGGNYTVHTTGDVFYARHMWDFHRIVELETNLYKGQAEGRVELRELEIIEPDED